MQQLHLLDMAMQLRDYRFRQNRGTPLVAFSQYLNPLAIKIDIFNSKPDTLHQPQAGTIQQLCH